MIRGSERMSTGDERQLSRTAAGLARLSGCSGGRWPRAGVGDAGYNRAFYLMNAQKRVASAVKGPRSSAEIVRDSAVLAYDLVSECEHLVPQTD